MSPEKTGDNIAGEVEDRLENLFGEDEPEKEPPAEPEELVLDLDEPADKPQEPALDLDEPADEAQDLALDLDEPADEAQDLALDLDAPADEAQEPALDLDEPADEAQEPVFDLDEPADEPQEPALDLDEPADEAQDLVLDLDEPADEPQEPVLDLEEPADEPQEPVFDLEEPAVESAGTGDSPIRELKAIVLSIDWEITDEVMNRFVEQIAELQDVFKDDKVVAVLLQLLGSIGEYIRNNLGKSHPEAFKILSSLYNNLDAIVHTEGMSDNDKRKLLSSELAKYKKLKGRLVPAEEEAEPIILPADAEVNLPSQEPTPESPSAMEELKQLFQTELQALRQEIQQLKKALAAKK